jgi:two-component system sensor histidine kinase KdpD
MVCLSSKGPNSEKLLRYASRLAGRLNRNWYAVYIQTPSEEPGAIDMATQRMLSDTLTLAKQLGALVFTYKGEDIVSTILQFAREYRVGHIILGSPARIFWWKRLAGELDIAEKLMHEAENITIIVHDTKTVERETPAKAGERTGIQPALTTSHLNLLSRFISPEGIVIYDDAVSKSRVLIDLTNIATGIMGMEDSGIILDVVLEREKQGSTFYNEGAAFPHARISGLKKSAVVVAIIPKGVSGAATDKPVQFVFLLLSPKENPDMQIRLLGLVSKAFIDKQLVEKILILKSTHEVIVTLNNWENEKKLDAKN